MLIFIKMRLKETIRYQDRKINELNLKERYKGEYLLAIKTFLAEKKVHLIICDSDYHDMITKKGVYNVGVKL